MISDDNVLGGRYRLTRRIAAGGMGEVWEARDEVLGRVVAVKLLRREFADDPSFVERFRAEARHTASLSHPGIAQVYDYGEADPAAGASAWLVMELVPGEPLSALLAREGPLDSARALDLVEQAAVAIQAAHVTGLVHRDVKPANIMVTPAGTVKVTDFGIARAVDAVSMTRTGEVIGSAHYLSPEQARAQPATPASDVYALGVVLYECLAGSRPFADGGALAVAHAHAVEEPPPLPASVPIRVRSLIERAMAKNPADRPATAGALAAEIATLRAGPVGPGTTRPATPAAAVTTALPAAAHDAPDRDRRRRLALLAVLGCVVALAAGLLGYAALRDVPSSALEPPDDSTAIVGSHSTTPSSESSPSAVTPLNTGPTATRSRPTTTPTSTSTGPSTTPSITPSPTDDTFVVVEAEYLGRPVGDVVSELRRLGLSVELKSQRDDDSEPGTVIDVSPEGPAAPGSEVTVRYAVGADDEGSGNDNSGSSEGDGDKSKKDRGKSEEDRGKSEEDRGRSGEKREAVESPGKPGLDEAPKPRQDDA